MLSRNTPTVVAVRISFVPNVGEPCRGRTSTLDIDALLGEVVSFIRCRDAGAACAAATAVLLTLGLSGGARAQMQAATDDQRISDSPAVTVNAQPAGVSHYQWRLSGPVAQATTEASFSVHVEPSGALGENEAVILELHNPEDSAVQFRAWPATQQVSEQGVNYYPAWNDTLAKVIYSEDECCLRAWWDAPELPTSAQSFTFNLVLRRRNDTDVYVDWSINDGPVHQTKHSLRASPPLSLRVGLLGNAPETVFGNIQVHPLTYIGATPWPTPRRTPISGPTPVPMQSLPQFTFDDQHPVLAYYYGWWEPDRLNWGVNQPVLQPVPGVLHIDQDLNLMANQIRQAMSAGIGGFVVNTPTALSVMLGLARGSQFRVSLQVDPLMNIETTLGVFYRHLDDPNLLRYEGKPVVFFWRTSDTTPDAWADLRARLDPDHKALWIGDGDKFDVLQRNDFDGISPYTSAWSANPGGTLASWASAAAANAPEKLFIPPVSPGCDDTPARTPPTCVTNRADGAYYRSAWSGALATRPRWAVMISTWNEWLEDTAIEPAVQYGDEYLRITREYADRLTGGVVNSAGAPTGPTGPTDTSDEPQ